MQKNREIIRLAFETKLSGNQIASSLKLSRGYVHKCVNRATEAGLGWPLPEDLDDTALDAVLFKTPRAQVQCTEHLPDWEYINKELRRKGVNLSLLWHEYCEKTEKPLSYSQFCKRYRNWLCQVNLIMRQDHRAGEKAFVDYAGHTVRLTERESGEVIDAQIFVSTLGASNYAYAEATRTQASQDWIGSNVRALEFYGGAPEMLVPDNLKVGVTKFHAWDPDLNPNYHRLAQHYGTSIVPARPKRPKDKAKVEKSVQFVETWILAALRNRQFFSLAELNAEIRVLLDKLNNRPFKKLSGSRREWFEQIDKPALKPLPTARYEDDDWRKVRVERDYHIEHQEHFYSVPYTLVGEYVFVRTTADTIEIFHDNNRVASHRLDLRKREKTTVTAHMSPAHKAHASWTPERVTRWSEKIGPATATVVRQILESCKYPQSGVSPARGILSLEKDFGSVRLENACKRALAIGTWSVTSIRSTLKYGLDKTTVQLAIPSLLPIAHENIRGPQYFKGGTHVESPNADKAPRPEAARHDEGLPTATRNT
jgi:transposase